MRLIVSCALPLLSHVCRQSFACSARFISLPAYTTTAFMAAYAVSMCIHAVWVDRVYSAWALRFVLLSFLTSFVFLLIASADVWFVALWTLHAVPSSAMWPLAYRLVNPKKRSRLFLVVWSTQGIMGDIVGCALELFDARSATVLWGSVSFMLSVILVAILAPSMETAHIEHTEQNDILLLTTGPQTAGTRRLSAILVSLSSASLKCITYSASNWMPSLHLEYWWYIASSLFGTILAGFVADQGLTRISLTVASSVLAVIVAYGTYDRLWGGIAFVVIFGALVSFCSTMFSICLCADLADLTEQYGATTAAIDGGATLVAAVGQLFAQESFDMVQLVSTAAFITTCIAFVAVSELRLRQSNT